MSTGFRGGKKTSTHLFTAELAAECETQWELLSERYGEPYFPRLTWPLKLPRVACVLSCLVVSDSLQRYEL